MFPRISVDFNKTGEGGLILTCYGTLRDLSRQQIRLKQGLELTFCMEDIEVDSRVVYQPGRNGTRGYWSAPYESADVRELPAMPPPDTDNSYPCFACRQDLHPYFEKHGFNQNTCCPFCGTSIMTPVLPPDA